MPANILNLPDRSLILLKRRTQYMAALEAVSVQGDIKPLAKFIAHEMRADARSLPVSWRSSKR